MILEFMLSHVFMCSILLFGCFSIFMQWIMTLSLRRYVKASANMKTTKNKIMIHLKKEFETIYEMDCHVRNVEAYVDKYLLKLRFLGSSFSFWEKTPALSAGIVTLIAGGTAFYTYTLNGNTPVLIEILFSYGVVLACLLVFYHIFGIKSKKQQMQIQLVDYLENYLTNRVVRNPEVSKETKVSEAIMPKDLLENTAKKADGEQVVLEDEKEIAVSKEPTDVELLEEFVQSFLA